MRIAAGVIMPHHAQESMGGKKLYVSLVVFLQIPLNNAWSNHAYHNKE
jgi:hypothetical protein